MESYTYNPNGEPEEALPAIFAFAADGPSGAARCYHGLVVAEDGTYLGGHISSSEDWLKCDLGVLDGGANTRCRQTYADHYPGGYRLEYVPVSEVPSHAGLSRAYRRNQEMRRAAATPAA